MIQIRAGTWGESTSLPSRRGQFYISALPLKIVQKSNTRVLLLRARRGVLWTSGVYMLAHWYDSVVCRRKKIAWEPSEPNRSPPTGSHASHNNGQQKAVPDPCQTSSFSGFRAGSVPDQNVANRFFSIKHSASEGFFSLTKDALTN